MTAPSTENEPKNCWEFMRCPKETREKCNAYKLDSGDDCWFLTNFISKRPMNKGGCFTCPWFKKNNPQLNR